MCCCEVFWDDEARALLLLLVDIRRSGVLCTVVRRAELFIPPAPSVSVFLDPPWDGKGPQKANSFLVVMLQRSLCPQHKLGGWGDVLLPLERAAPEGARFHMECVSVAYVINPVC